MGTTTCTNHPSEPAKETCNRCLKEFCHLCVQFEGADWLCKPCLKQVRAHRSQVRAGVGLAVALALGGGGWYVSTHPATGQGGERAATGAGPVDLGLADCNRSTIIERGEALVGEDRYQDALDLSERFFARCGEYLRLRWVTHAAHSHLSEWDKAIADVSKLIEADPYDKDYRGWRGLDYEEKGDLEKAIEDFRTALSLEPRLQGIPFNLADLLERVSRPCEAIFPIEQFLHYYVELRQDPTVQARLDKLYGDPACKDTRGEGRATIRFPPRTSSIPCRARFNGTREGNLIVDTGASFVTLSRAFAEQLGLAEKPGVLIPVQTAGGIRPARLTTLDRLEVQGVKAARVEVAIVDDLPEQVDGLLGLSFLSRFELSLDSARGVLTLSAHGRAARR